MLVHGETTVGQARHAETAVVLQCNRHPPCTVSAQRAEQRRPMDVAAECQEAHRAEESDFVGCVRPQEIAHGLQSGIDRSDL